jgi:hypothetical protein
MLVSSEGITLSRRLESEMKYLPMILVLGSLFSMAIIACQQPIGPVITHKLVVTGNLHAVPMFPDEQTYLHTSHEKQEGGVVGVVGDVKQNLVAKQLDDQTPVQVVSADDNGAVVIVTDGPMKGATGFVPKQNID